MTIEALTRAFGDVQQLSAEMFSLRAACPPGWRKTYVAMRRQAQINIQNVGDAGEACFRAGICTHLEAEFRGALNAMRAAVAFHQAQWPVVVVEPQNLEYCASLQEVMKAIRVFEDVVERMLSVGRAAA